LAVSEVPQTTAKLPWYAGMAAWLLAFNRFGAGWMGKVLTALMIARWSRGRSDMEVNIIMRRAAQGALAEAEAVHGKR
jgi:hypothetical protein